MDHRPHLFFTCPGVVICSVCCLLSLGLVATSVFGQEPPAVSLNPIAEPYSGPALMKQVVAAIQRHRSVSAKIRHRTDLFGQQLVGSGLYLQQQSTRGLQVRFSLSLKAGDQPAHLLHVCDGRYLWMSDNLDGNQRLSRLDLPTIRRAEKEQGGGPYSYSLGGGLPRLLVNLQRSFAVASPQAVTFQEVPMWALALRWHPQRLRELVPDANLVDEQGRIKTDELPPQFPDRVFLLVGQDDLFPYHIDFRRTESDRGLAVVDARSPSRSVATMELFEVQYNAAIDPVRFAYVPPKNVQFENQTDDYLRRMQALKSTQKKRRFVKGDALN